ncbi:FecR family protein [Metasolibacillus sp. FSL H7-0170]|uniref:FecR family protein n=1 Tax=Metasolibacillus sp. FSL H7-0170 TaxID=2921431 RepID=UPI0031585E1B
MNKKMVIIVVAVTSIVFLSLFAYLFVNKETKVVGKVLSISGLVEVKKETEDKILKVFANMAFTEGDTLMTGVDGRAELAIDNNKEISIAPSTDISFTQLVTSLNAGAGKTYLYLREGKVKIKINEKLKGDSRFNIETPNAIMGVMGTEFFVYYDSTGTWVGVLEGQVEVVTGENRILLVPLNKSVFIGYDGEIEIVDLDMEQVQKFDMEIISSANEDIQIVAAQLPVQSNENTTSQQENSSQTFINSAPVRGSVQNNSLSEQNSLFNVQAVGEQALPLLDEELSSNEEESPLNEEELPLVEENLPIEEQPLVEEQLPNEEQHTSEEDLPLVEGEPSSYEEELTYEEDPPYKEDPPNEEEDPPYEQDPPNEEEDPPYEENPPYEEEDPSYEEESPNEEEDPPYEEEPPNEEEDPPYEEEPPNEEEDPPYEEEPPNEEEAPPYEENPPNEEEDPPYEEEPPNEEEGPPYEEEPPYEEQPPGENIPPPQGV